MAQENILLLQSKTPHLLNPSFYPSIPASSIHMLTPAKALLFETSTKGDALQWRPCACENYGMEKKKCPKASI